ncbi:MAG: FHA domain-containing protein [Victivallales bacterium]|nr:FHA domain-containing protein [Victivallales bacterium]
MFSSKELIIRFELNNEVLKEVSSKEIHEEISIGRNPASTWVIPPTDKSASNNHAKLFVKGGHVIIKDMQSRNGTFFQGERITEHKMAAGDQVRIGDCLLKAEAAEETGGRKPVHPFNRLEQLNGEAKGKLYDLDQETMKIGSAPDCAIIFNDAVISHYHVALDCRPDGSTWIKDLGSRNGTKVNGSPLSTNLNDSARLLKDGDVITISYIELRYWDKYVQHVRSHIGLKIAAVVLTLVVVLGGYFLWLNASPSAKSHIEKARLAAQNENFKSARSHLEAAANSRGADTHRYERSELANQIDQWEDTIAKWAEVKELFADGRWISANKILSPMLSSNMELWKWNDTTAAQAKNEALLVKRVNDAFLEARTTLEENSSTPAAIEASIKNISHELDTLPGSIPEFCQPLIKAATDVKEEIIRTSDELKAVDAALNDFKDITKLPDVISRLESIADNAAKRHEERKKDGVKYSTKVETFVADLRQPLDKLANAQKALQANYEATATLAFAKIAAQLPLPTPAECGVYPVLADKRSELEKLNETLCEDAKQFKNLVDTLANRNLTPDQMPDYMKNLFNKQVQADVLDCDIFKHPLPRWNRTEPAGNYDRVLGLEIFYNFLAMLPAEFDSASMEDASFKPDIYLARQDFKVLEDFLKFWERDSFKDVRNIKKGNKAADYIMHADEVIEQRDSLVVAMKKLALAGEDRSAAIAGGIAILLGQQAKLLPDDFPETINAKVRAVRAKTNAIAKQEATPEQIIANRQKILDIGIPGDSIVKVTWAEIKR